MSSYKDFNQWLLSQLKDPDLHERAKRRMENSIVWDVSGIDGPEITRDTDRRIGEEERARVLIAEHCYEPDGYWLNRLTQQRSATVFHGVGQVDRETNSLFEHLANFSNMLVYRKNSRSRRGTEEEARFEGVQLTPVVLQRLYYYSRETVINHYDPDREEEKESIYFPYLQRALGRRQSADLLLLTEELCRRLPEIDSSGYLYFGYTARGEKRLWWDPEGDLRRRHSYSEKQLRRLQVEPARLTFVWELEPMKLRILDMFDYLCDRLEEELRRDVPWRNLAMKRYVSGVVCGDRQPANPKRYDLMSTVLRQCEIKVRASVEGFPRLTEGEDVEILRRRLPGPVREVLESEIRGYRPPDLDLGELAVLCNQTRYGTKIAGAWLADRRQRPEDLLHFLDQLDEPLAGRILMDIAQDYEDSIKRLDAFLQWRKSGKRSKLQKYDQSRLFHPSQVPVIDRWIQFATLPEKEEELCRLIRTDQESGGTTAFSPDRKSASTRDGWASCLAEALDLLTQRRMKKIRLDLHKIEASRVNLQKTVDLVDNMLSEEDLPEPLQPVSASDSPDAEDRGEGTSGGGIVLSFDADEGQAEEAEAVQGGLDGGGPFKIGKKLFQALAADGADWIVGEETLAGLAAEGRTTPSVLVAQINEACFDEIGADLLLWEGGGVTVDPYDRDWLLEQIETEE